MFASFFVDSDIPGREKRVCQLKRSEMLKVVPLERLERPRGVTLVAFTTQGDVNARCRGERVRVWGPGEAPPGSS